MTKDELNEILKEDSLELDKQFNGIGKAGFIVRTTYSPNKQAINFNGVDFYVQNRSCFSPWILKALADYANTPIEERKPKPQLYNIVIAHDTDTDNAVTAWSKDGGEFSVFDSVTDNELMVDKNYQFTEDDIHKLKQQLSEKEAAIVDLGITRVKTKKEEGALPF